MPGGYNLAVRDKAIDLVVDVYRLSTAFPDEERYGITSQLRRAMVSIPLNIAEGRGRLHQREFLHHLSIARGSLAEVETLFEIVQRLEYAPAAALVPLKEALSEIARMLTGLIRSVAGDNAPLHGR